MEGRDMQGRFHYHTIIKSIRGRVIFYRDYDRLLFLNILRRFVDKFNVQVVEFVLMDNHIHLLHTAESFVQAITFAGELQQNFAFWYNRFHSSKDKFFVPAKVYPKKTKEAIIKCCFYILQNPMVACPKDYPHPKDFLWSSYHFHYDFMCKCDTLVKHPADVHHANATFDIINRSRSKERNKCPQLRSGFEWLNLKLSDYINVNTFELDVLYTKREFKLLVHKSLVSSQEEYANERAHKIREYLKNNKVALSKLSDLLVLLLEERKYEELSFEEKELLINDLFTYSKATIMQVVMLLDEDKAFVAKLYRNSR